MKILMILDQVQAGLGTKDDKMVELGGKKEAVGPALMMKPMLSKVSGTVIASIHCGTGTFFTNEEEVTRKITAMVTKLNPDVVVCGPSYNFPDYSNMAARVAESIQSNTQIPVLCAMSEENDLVINEYKDVVTIVKMPKKGGFGLNESLQNICDIAKAKVEKEEINKEFCY